MTEYLTVEEATDALSRYTQAAIASKEALDLQNKLLLEQRAREQEQIELKRQEIAIIKQVENRRNAQINRLLEQVARSEQKTTAQITDLLSKFATVDDNFGDTVQRIIQIMRGMNDAIIDVQRAILAMLAREAGETRRSQGVIARDTRASAIQKEMLVRIENLSQLELDAAGFGSLDVPLKLRNEIKAEREAIEELETKWEELRQ